MFLVQLKATDQVELGRALTVKIKKEQHEYYRQLDMPVLIVRYHVPTKKIFVKWHHTFDAYYSKKGAKSLSIKLSQSDEWHEQKPYSIVSDLDAIRIVKSPQIPLPFPCSLRVDGDSVHGVIASHMDLLIRQTASRLPNAVLLTGNSPLLSIVVGEQEVSVTLADGKGFTYHTSKGYPQEFAKNKFPFDVMLSIALALSIAGHNGIAAQLITEFGHESHIISQPEIALRLSHCLAKAQRVIEALRLSENLMNDAQGRHIADLFFLTAFSKSGSLSTGESEYFKEHLKRRIELAEIKGSQTELAVAHYNLGNHLRGRNRWQALRQYKKASKHDPNYLKRSYFLAELAGILFLNGRYALASKYYDTAIQLGGDCIALHADALMFRGSYKRSEELFESFLESNPEGNSEWHLKLVALKFIRANLKIDEQQRKVEAATNLFDNCESISDNQMSAAIMTALQLDALCGLAWFNQGVLAHKSNSTDKNDALQPFLIEALVNNWDVESWCNAMMLSVSSQTLTLFTQILETAYRFNRSKFVEQIVRFSKSQSSAFPADQFVQLVVQHLRDLPEAKPPVVARLLKSETDYEVINLNTTEESPAIDRKPDEADRT
jgi:tetratricopeptide (TPR) repeat protein